MKKRVRIRYILLPAILLFGLGYIAYIFLHFVNYKEYRKYLTAYTVEEGTAFEALPDSQVSVKGMVLAAETEQLKLYTNTKTTEIAVYDKRSGETTYSNPQDREDDPLASGRNRVALNSQFMLTYYDISMTMIQMYNYDYSVERNQVEIEAIDKGIRYTYLLGNLDSPTGLVPPFITQERLEEKILSKLTEKEAKSIRNNYMESKSMPGFLELSAGTQSSKIALQKMNKLLESAEYTQEDFDEEASLAAGGKLPERTTFTIALEYRLEGDTLKVSVPTNMIKETGSGTLANIDLLSFFGAGGSEEEGYILVPNGTGSLIYFNNGKKTERYNQYIYGMDETVKSYTTVEDTEKVRMPVFGIKRPKSAVFAEITKGDPLANILSEVSGSKNSYNYVYASFVLRGSEQVYMFGVAGVSADLPVLEKDLYDMDITVEYSFLEEKNASYSGMANYYRDKLIARGELALMEQQDSIPFHLDILGGVKMQKSVLGVPYLSVYPMTDFDSAAVIVNEFKEQGIHNLRVNYLGWFNGGYYHNILKNIKVDRKLGGKKDLADLNKELQSEGIKLYGDVGIQKISFNAENKYKWKMENARYYAGYTVITGRTNPATLRISNMGYAESMYNVLSPKFLVRHTNWLLDEIDDIPIYGLSLRDLGDIVASDKKRTEIINRQQSKEVVVGQLNRIHEAAGGLMINGGNAYAWAYAEELQNIPASHNPFYIVDEEVPFYQMVIHGCINYSTTAINLSDSFDKQNMILRMIEFGMVPHFTLSYEDSSEMKYSGMNDLYSTQYEIWMGDAVEIYGKANEALKEVSGSVITEHTTLQSGVKRITYNNGHVIYVNYNNTDVNVDGISVPAMGYQTKGERGGQ